MKDLLNLPLNRALEFGYDLDSHNHTGIAAHYQQYYAGLTSDKFILECLHVEFQAHREASIEAEQLDQNIRRDAVYTMRVCHRLIQEERQRRDLSVCP